MDAKRNRKAGRTFEKRLAGVHWGDIRDLADAGPRGRGAGRRHATGQHYETGMLRLAFEIPLAAGACRYPRVRGQDLFPGCVNMP